MAIWIIRAGSHGEYEQKFIQESCIGGMRCPDDSPCLEQAA